MDQEERIGKLERELAELKAQMKPKPEPEPAEPFKPREPWQKYDPTENFRLPESAAKAMAWPDVKGGEFNPHAWAQTKVGEPGGFGGPDVPREPAKERGSGWAKPVELGSPSGIRWVDQMCEAQDRLDRAERMKGFGSVGSFRNLDEYRDGG